MAEIGVALASEDWSPRELVELARSVEEAGFEYAFISDHYHPWVDAQGSSPFVWSVIGGIAEATERLRLATGVTCPLIRIHPAIVAQAAATSACMMPGRFMLGIGTGENLNEHILGDPWPAADVRLEMFVEAIEVMRLLWQGGEQTFRGDHYTVDHARVYNLPDEPVELAIAAGAPNAAKIAGEHGDALVNSAPDPDVVKVFDEGGGSGKPRYGMLHACWGEDEDGALEIAHRLWANIALKGELGRELPRPSDFEDAVRMVSREDIAEVVPCGPDPDLHREHIKRYENAGYDHVFVHQIGEDQAGFLRFYANEILAQV
jgi:coenzyme F420-dependent glucose-6-phosphate dehydrogenase